MNSIRELKQQEKYKNMLKRKNREKKIYKDKNASLQLEKQRLCIALRNRDQEIERLNNIINNAIETIKDEGLVVAIKITNGEEETLLSSKELLLDILKGSDKE